MNPVITDTNLKFLRNLLRIRRELTESLEATNVRIAKTINMIAGKTNES